MTTGEGQGGGAALPLLPTREIVLFPRMVAPLFVGREKSVSAIETAFAAQSPLILCAQREAAVEDPSLDDLRPMGVRARVLQLYKLPDGSVKALVEGDERVRTERVVASEPHLVIEYTAVESPDADTARARSLARRVTDEFARYVHLHPGLADEAQFVVQQAGDTDQLADIVAAHLQTEAAEKQALLEIVSTQERLLALLESLVEENAVLGVEQELALKVQERIEGAQRQMLLQEKLRVLRDEIEEAGEEPDEDIADYARRADEAQLSPAARRLVTRELTKLRQAPPMSPEIAVIRGFLDTVLDLPWGKLASAEVDVVRVSRHLERTHHGLKDVKDRILEYLAVCRLRADAGRAGGGASVAADQPATILCLAGPPGTGKSSIAQSIADALRRPFVRVALGGVRDEAEIRGHRRTYIGAMPGRIVEGLAKAGVDNPVMLLDELDKLDSDWRGNPAAALMEVLDPAHNHAFRDNYLEAEYDLSRVFFIATANDVDAVPATLYDRLEVIPLSGYTMTEKLAIARRHLLPRVARDTGLGRGDVRYARGVLQAIIRDYTREAGVRELERALRRIDRKVARRHLEEGLGFPVTVRPGDLRGYLGEAHWLEAELPRRGSVGESLGLAYTSDGGEVLTIEATLSRGRGELVLTGQLGEVMQESASTAWGHLLAYAEHDPQLRRLVASSPFLTADGLDLSTQDVRVHVPEGAVPKDGPSAGLALATAMLSALARTPVRPRVAMTGEITLGGRILRVGGLKEKLLAAARSGVRTVVLPAANRGTIEELPHELTARLDLVYVANLREALPHVFGDEVSTRRASKGHGQPASREVGAKDMHDHEHDHQTPGSTEEPGVDAGSGTLEKHCSQCGGLIEGSDEFCQVCAIEYSGGEVPENKE
ncbi:MAG: endopeptidase La [Actinobacteria bacterium]|nr:endopeptidase La [Actinomycetota bacterium]